MPLFNGYGEAVKRLRKGRGMSQRAVAKLAQVNVMTLRRIEKQIGDTSLGTLDSVFSALGVLDLRAFVIALEGERESPTAADKVRQSAPPDDFAEFVKACSAMLGNVPDVAERQVLGALFAKQTMQRAEIQRFLPDRTGVSADVTMTPKVTEDP